MTLAHVTLDDKYELESGRVYLTGTQALTRLPMLQRQRDDNAGLKTACFISGYRGSPLGGFDQTLWKAKKHLEKYNIYFQPGVNEDLGATAVWGSQQVNMFEGAKYDGVFGMWYGKGPGIDRTGDVFKHANAAGTSKHGGVLVIAGDDHACKSSTLPHQSEYTFMDAMMPVLNPSGVQEILDLGIFGWELSRYCGCWVALKTIAETVDSSFSAYVDPNRVNIVIPDSFELPDDGLHCRWPDKPLEQEYRLQKYKLYAALAFAKANKLDRVVIDSPQPRFGIVTTGKAYLDVCQALDDLGIDENLAAEIGLRVYKVGMSWPLESSGVREFARGLEEVLVVEEKRGVIENQLKEQLYNWDENVRPRVVGKFNEARDWILPSTGELTPAQIARVIAKRIGTYFTSERIEKRLAFLEAKEAALAKPRAIIERTPHFCSGCPHNTSTQLPEGSRALGGIGCHYMATWMDRGTDTFTQMGGEGVTWIGQSTFTDTKHIFQNLGDGTYFHSGSLAIRAAIAAKVNITYKILYNDAVAMTGGQPVDGSLSLHQITHQLYGEGIRDIVIVSDDPKRHTDHSIFAKGVDFYHRDDLDHVQRQLREVKGASVLIYDQVCAAEKRRRRKKGIMVDPPKRAYINEAVCEGCGDCGIKSNCLSILPLETELGRKRMIDQSACNKDFSCVNGFCPSFVTVHGGQLVKPKTSGTNSDFPDLPTPTLPSTANPYGIVITGVGGTGVVTIGALLGMAAHLEGKGCSVLDMTGLAQKFGAVVSHVRIADKPEAIHAVRIAAGRANLLLGCDLVVAANYEALAKLNSDDTYAVVNSHDSMPAAFTKNPDLQFPRNDMEQAIIDATSKERAEFIDATRIATDLMGDSIASNLFMVGYAYQKGLLPLSAEAIEKAIDINGVAAESNKRAFLWGRRAAHDLAAVKKLATPQPTTDAEVIPLTLDSLIERRKAHLTAYQNTKYAQRYADFVAKVRAADTVKIQQESLTKAVAENYAKLLAYKDEYEVARLYSDANFTEKLQQQFEGDFQLKFYLAPPLLAKRDPHTGEAKKREFGAWVLPVFKQLAKFKCLRGTALDIFSYTADRKLERQLISDYEQAISNLLPKLTADNYHYAVELARLPEKIRGFGHVKQANAEKAAIREATLKRLIDNPNAVDGVVKPVKFAANAS